MTQRQTDLATPLLQVTDLQVEHVGSRQRLVSALNFTLTAGRTLCLVGESGSGKTLTAMAIAGLLPAGLRAQGQLRLAGETLSLDEPARSRAQRVAQMGVVFQNPSAALNPRLTIGEQLLEALPPALRQDSVGGAEAALALLHDVGLPDPLRKLSAWPHELSGGQAQRVVIAMALARSPRVLVADEPTTALDVTVQAQILDLIARLQARHGFAVLLITHDIGVVRDRADDVLVMADGRAVEQAAAQPFFAAPRSPQAQALLTLARVALTPPAPAPEPVAAAPWMAASAVSKRYGAGRPALDQVSLQIAAGQTVGIVGESGSGKTTLARILAGLARQDGGRVEVQGKVRTPGQRAVGVQYVFQDPYSALNPRLSAWQAVAEPLLARQQSRAEAMAAAQVLLDEVGLPAALWQRLPSQLSGGQRQRVVIARALASAPSLLIADEPVAALDLRVRDRILTLLAQVQQRRGMAQLIISHDLAVIARLCRHTVVMRHGVIVEQGPTHALLANAQHPYTRQLFEAMPGRLARADIAPLIDISLDAGV